VTRSSLLNPLRHATRAFLSLLYPERCQLCRNAHAAPADGWVCPECRDSIRFIQAPACDRCGLPFNGDIRHRFECANCKDLELAFTRARSAIRAEGSARELIHHYKYHRAYWLEPLFAQLWLPVAVPDLAGQPWAGIVPIPLHPVRLREREFNQAERLARILADALHLPVRTDLVRRIHATASQTCLSRDERAANVRRAFEPLHEPDLTGTRWIVVDDVLTTGATCDAVARILLRRGAEEVVVWTLARGI
jgi:competence protein ComFC